MANFSIHSSASGIFLEFCIHPFHFSQQTRIKLCQNLIMKFNKFFLGFVIISGCKGAPTASSAVDLETCSVPQSEFVTTTAKIMVCQARESSVLYDNVYQFLSDGTYCLDFYEQDGTYVSGGCNGGTWERTSCDSVAFTFPADPTRQVVTQDFRGMEKTTDGFIGLTIDLMSEDIPASDPGKPFDCEIIPIN